VEGGGGRGWWVVSNQVSIICKGCIGGWVGVIYAYSSCVSPINSHDIIFNDCIPLSIWIIKSRYLQSTVLGDLDLLVGSSWRGGGGVATCGACLL
jgi:hypothetical protein